MSEISTKGHVVLRGEQAGMRSLLSAPLLATVCFEAGRAARYN